VKLTETQKKKVKEIAKVCVEVKDTTSIKKLSLVIDQLIKCDTKIKYAVIVLMPIQLISSLADCADGRVRASINKITNEVAVLMREIEQGV
jgi:hypothetical protein